MAAPTLFSTMEYNTWNTGLIDCNDNSASSNQNAVTPCLITFEIVKAGLCPCVEMHSIAHSLLHFSSNAESNHDDQHSLCSCCSVTWIATHLASVIVDIPLLFCCDIMRNKAIHHTHYNHDESWLEEEGGADDVHTHHIAEPPFYLRWGVQRGQEEHAPNSPWLFHEDDTEWNPEHSSYDWWPLSWFCFYAMASFENCCSSLCCGPSIRQRDFPVLYALCIACMYPACVMPLSCLLRQAAKDKLNIQHENILSTCFQSICCAPCSLVQVRKTLEYGKPRKFIVKQEKLVHSHPQPRASVHNFFLKNDTSQKTNAPVLLNFLHPSHAMQHP